MKIHLICLGNLKEVYLRNAQNDLVASLIRKNGVTSCQVIELKEEALKDHPTAIQIQGALLIEASRILEKIPSNARLICLDINGKPAAADFFSGLSSAMFELGQTNLVLIIGGSNGIDESIKRKAHHRISFSHLTYPHQLFRVALLEALMLYL